MICKGNGLSLDNSDTLRHFKNTLWFRSEQAYTHFAKLNLAKDVVMIVGHTTQKQGPNLKYINGDSNYPMFFIDGGLVNKLGGFSLDGHIIKDLETPELQKTSNERNI